MSVAAEFPYPGDDPAELIAVSAAFYNAQGRFDSVAQSIGEAKSSMAANWVSDAATAAGADLGKLRTALSASSTHLGTAARAVDTYQGDLVKIRSSVDDLRAALNKQETELSGEQTQYARAGRFGEINDMTPAQVASYRSGITSDEARTQREIRHLRGEYAALVRRANTSTATCREALSTSIHGQQYNGSTLSTVGLGPALGLGNLTMLAAWEAAVENNGPSFPKGKTPAQTAQLVAAYWASLPPEVQQAFIHQHPKDVGNVDGVPIVDRSAANVISAHSDQNKVIAVLRTMPNSAAIIARLLKHPGDIQYYLRGIIGRQSGGHRLNNTDVQSFINATSCLNAKSNDEHKTSTTAYLMTYDPTAFGGDGRAAVAIGNPDTADNTAVCVPGLSQKVSNYIGSSDEPNLYNQMHSSDPTHTQSVVTWMGYNAPGLTNVASEGSAVSGGTLLAAAVGGLQTTHQGGPGQITVIAHSYGSTTAADACVLNGMRPSNLVLIGSPGAGHAHTAADLGLPPGHVYVGSASQDPVTHIPDNYDNPLGTDPANTSFGATRFHTESVDRGDDWGLAKPTDHSRYYSVQVVDKIPTSIPSQSLQNLGDIATGHGQTILHNGELAGGRGGNWKTVEMGPPRAPYLARVSVDPDSQSTPHWGSPQQ